MLEEIQNNRYRLQPAFIQDVIHTSDYSLPIKGKSSDGLPAEVLTGRLFWLHYFLAQVLVNMTDKIDKGGTIAIRIIK